MEYAVFPLHYAVFRSIFVIAVFCSIMQYSIPYAVFPFHVVVFHSIHTSIYADRNMKYSMCCVVWYPKTMLGPREETAEKKKKRKKETHMWVYIQSVLPHIKANITHEICRNRYYLLCLIGLWTTFSKKRHSSLFRETLVRQSISPNQFTICVSYNGRQTSITVEKCKNKKYIRWTTVTSMVRKRVHS